MAEEKLDIKLVSKRIISLAELTAPFSPDNDVEAFSKACQTGILVFGIKRPATILQAVEGAMTEQAQKALFAALISPAGEAVLATEATYLKDLVALIKKIFRPVINPLEGLPKLLAL